METSVLLFRHGEPKDHPDCCKGNRLDCALSEEGERQTMRNVLWAMTSARNHLASTLVVTSPLKRARRFSEIWRELTDTWDLEQATHLITPEFTDIDVGKWEGKPWDDIARDYPDQYALLSSKGEELQLPGGEDLQVFIARIRSVWQRVTAIPSSHLIMVGHSATNEVILADAAGKPHLNFKSQRLGCANKIEIDSRGIARVAMHNTILHDSAHHECA